MKLMLVISVFLLAACGGGDSPAPPPTPDPTPGPKPPSLERAIAPAASDSQISTDLESHIAINPEGEVPEAGRLFVFLPATGTTPSSYRAILRTGAARGYHTIGLNYPNQIAVAELCRSSDDADCHGKVRREVISGIDSSPLGTVTSANSIINRLQKLLLYLHAEYPREGWGQYLEQDEIVWSKINLAGHSQGGGHAGMMSKLFAMNRVIYFSSPFDVRVPEGVAANWTALPNRTDAARQFGFTHLEDGPQLVGALWQSLGLDSFGPPIQVDNALPPYSDSHQLTTNAVPNLRTTAGTAHNATVVDLATPRTSDGAALFQPVWTYLAFP